MKVSKFVLGIIVGAAFVALIGADQKEQSSTEASRYHMAPVGNMVFVYDGITGDYKNVSYYTAKNNESIKTLLTTE